MCKYDHYAKVRIKNNMGGTANIRLTHQYGSYQPDNHDCNDLPNNHTTGTFKAYYNTGIGSKGEYWWIRVDVTDGPNRGTYYCENKECYFKSADAGHTHTFSVDTKKFHINMEKSSSCTGNMTKNPFY